eukprot:13690491-Ditylum_brightwellii.AAC.1
MLGTPQWTNLRPVQGIGTINKTHPRWYNKRQKVTKGHLSSQQSPNLESSLVERGRLDCTVLTS